MDRSPIGHMMLLIGYAVFSAAVVLFGAGIVLMLRGEFVFGAVVAVFGAFDAFEVAKVINGIKEVLRR